MTKIRVLTGAGRLLSVLTALAAATFIAPVTADDSFAVPLHMFDAGAPNPVVFIAVNGSAPVPVQVDTGSTGLVILDRGIPRAGLDGPVGSGTAGYNGMGGRKFGYDTFKAPVTFCPGGDGCEPALSTFRPVSINVIDAGSDAEVAEYFSHYGIVGILGIGPNDGFPGTGTVVSALPGALGQGVLIDEPAGRLVFGPNPFPEAASAPGSPFVDVRVSVAGSEPVPVRMSIDSGGGRVGFLPRFVVPDAPVGTQLPAGTDIEVYTADGAELLYSYTTTEDHRPMVTDGQTAGSGGWFPFSVHPVYIGHRLDGGRTVIDR